MKPITLTIAGLHSFREEQVIPFDTLSDRGVFGIFGSTGSGKSTVLDALTLALFGRVVRAKNKTQGILNTDEDALTVSFLFELRTARGAQRFRADRKYVRKDAVAVRHRHSRLVLLDELAGDQVVAEGESKVTGAVEELLGMKAEDFTRAVVLPQNRFAEFITLDGVGKRNMLQRLFALERYGKQLTDRFLSRFNAVAVGLEGVNGELAGLGDASAQALAQVEQRAEKAALAARLSAAKLTETEQQYQHAARVWNWQEELQQVEKNRADHAARQDEIKAIERRVERGERAARVLPLVRAWDEAAAQEEQGRNSRAQAAARAQECQILAAQCRERSEKAQKELEQTNPQLLARQSILEAAQKQEQELQQLDQEIRRNMQRQEQQTLLLETSWADINKQEQILTSWQDEIRCAQGELEQNRVSGDLREQAALLDQAAAALLTSAQTRQHAAGELRKRLAGLEQALRERQQTAADLAAWERDWRLLRDQEEQLQPPVSDEALAREELRLAQFKDGLDQLTKLGSRLQQAGSDESGLAGELAGLQKAQLRAAARNDRVNRYLAAAKERYQKDYLENKRVLAARLAADLTPGAPCPVCGALEHPHPAATRAAKETADTQQIVRLGERISRAEQLAREIAAEINALAAAVSGAKARLTVLGQDRAQLEQEITARGRRLWGTDFTLPHHWPAATANWQREAQQKEKQWQERQKQLQDWREERRLARIALAERQEQLTRQKTADAAAAQKITAARKELAGARDALTHAGADWAAAQGNLRSALLQYQRSLDGPTTLPAGESARQWLAGARQARQQIKAMDLAAENITQGLAQLRARLEPGQEKLEHQRQAKNTLETDLARLQARLAEQQKQLAKGRQELEKSTAGQPAAALLERVRAEMNTLQARVRDAGTAAAAAENKKNEADRALAGSNTALGEMEKRLRQTRRELDEALQKYRFTTAGEAADAFLDEAEIASQSQTIAVYRDEEKMLLAEKTRLLNLLEDQSISPEKWQALGHELAEARAQKEQCAKDFIEAEKDRQDLKRRHIRWQELEQKRQTLDRQLTALETLKKLFRGDSFMQFLAHEQLEFVVQLATDKLKQMTGGRYALLVDADGNFLIRDDANGSVVRPVTSLSGGETFQASLALALALSTQIQLRGRHPLEFFFLDEGFGALDQEALETMVTTLEGLYLERTTIGVISHVAELQQRIGRKLLVEPAETGGRGSRVRLDFG